ncbi:DUF5723 family protein [Galbibacter sp. EGI 63066]|uniref:DUF5723 family protein n=1 Tax=Galbibacter sp. EGI 63066 TaxID=2993559 RepID=UPI00224936B1|nr:DUF5723 family protein [Galbibacter sp. EGI 63066]MCX2679491.1 DUF5723 family protein [Galbibacter sp. EGI 63066]
MMTSKITLFLMLLIGICLHAQNKQLLYNFTEIPQSLMINPGGKIDFKWYTGLPLASGIYANVGSSETSVYDLFADNGVDFNTKVRNAVYNLNSNDVQRVHQQWEVFNAGFRVGGLFRDDYITFGFYQEIDAFNYWPEDMAILAYEGNSPNIDRPFRLDDVNVKGELLTVFHVGFHSKINDKINYGVRAKVYNSIIDFTSTNNSGFFVTTEGDENFYAHTLVSDVEVNTSGYARLREDDVDGAGNVIDILKSRKFFGGNLGLGVDFGITYEPTEEWTYTASVQDLGFVRHTKNVERYRLRGDYTLEGIELPFDDLFDSSGLTDNWQELVDALDEAFPRDTLTSPYTTMRPVKFNAAVMHNYGDRYGNRPCDCRDNNRKLPNSVGLQLFMEKRPKRPEMAITAFYYRRLWDFLRGKVTYTADKFSKTNIGLGLSTHFANFNFYLLTDNLLEYQNLADANNASIQFGLNYIFPMDN